MIRLYIGKSASGKDTLCRRICESSDGKIKPIVSSTTRPPRDGEIDGRDYNFETRETFMDKVSKGDIIEYRRYNAVQNGKSVEWLYGSPKVDIEKEWAAVVDIDGALAYIKNYGSFNLEITYVFADSDIRETRAKSRGSFDKTEWDRRAAADDKAFDYENLKRLTEAYGRHVKYFCNNKERT